MQLSAVKQRNTAPDNAAIPTDCKAEARGTRSGIYLFGKQCHSASPCCNCKAKGV